MCLNLGYGSTKLLNEYIPTILIEAYPALASFVSTNYIYIFLTKVVMVEVAITAY